MLLPRLQIFLKKKFEVDELLPLHSLKTSSYLTKSTAPVAGTALAKLVGSRRSNSALMIQSPEPRTNKPFGLLHSTNKALKESYACIRGQSKVSAHTPFGDQLLSGMIKEHSDPPQRPALGNMSQATESSHACRPSPARIPCDLCGQSLYCNKQRRGYCKNLQTSLKPSKGTCKPATFRAAEHGAVMCSTPFVSLPDIHARHLGL